MLQGVRILAQHHDSGLNGAGLLFQAILEGLVKEHGAAVFQLFPREGPLVARARESGPVRVENPYSPARRRRLVEWVTRGRGRVPGSPGACDLIFSNSIASLGAVERLLERDRDLQDVPLVVYVHESAFLLQEYDFSATRRMLRHARLIFAVSTTVRETLVELIQPAATISVVSGFLLERQGGAEGAELTAAVRDAAVAGARIVGGAGTIAWYKGPDLFIAVARRIRDLLPRDDLRFIWIGKEFSPDIRRLLERDIAKAGLAGIVILPGETPDPRSFFESLSVFMLPSREDSWPLVMLEAAAEGVPIVCFRGSGGAEDFLANGGGTAVPYLDVEAMAQAVVRYLSEPDLIARDADIARRLAGAVSGEEQVEKVATGIARMLQLPVPN